MSISYIPRRAALSIGIALIRWARGTIRVSSRISPGTLLKDVEHSSTITADPVRGASRQAEARTRAIRQHHVARQVEREREEAVRRYLTLPRQL